MPNYDYFCEDCSQSFSIRLSYQEYENATVQCPTCHSKNVVRKINRVHLGKSDKARLSTMSDSSEMQNVDNDPRALGRMMRNMKEQTGVKDEGLFNDVVGRLEKGETPASIDKDYS